MNNLVYTDTVYIGNKLNKLQIYPVKSLFVYLMMQHAGLPVFLPPVTASLGFH